MTQELVKKEATHLTVADQGGGGEQILRSDVLIPRLLLMQGMSEFVKKRQAQIGDMVRSTTGEKLGNPDQPIEIIPLTFRNLWRLEEKVGQKFEYRGTEPRTARNEELPWEFMQNGAEWRRTKVMDLFALLPADIDAELVEIKRFEEGGEMPDLNKTLLPVLISFRSKSFTAGREVMTHFAKAQQMARFGVKPYGFTLVLKNLEETNDKGSFQVFRTSVGKRVTPEQLAKAEEWYHVLSTQRVVVDEDAETEEATAKESTNF